MHYHSLACSMSSTMIASVIILPGSAGLQIIFTVIAVPFPCFLRHGICNRVSVRQFTNAVTWNTILIKPITDIEFHLNFDISTNEFAVGVRLGWNKMPVDYFSRD